MLRVGGEGSSRNWGTPPDSVDDDGPLPEGPKALEEDWERAGSGAALVLTNQWLL